MDQINRGGTNDICKNQAGTVDEYVSVPTSA